MKHALPKPLERSLPHYRALDGLRGLAILAVFYSHVGSTQLDLLSEHSPIALRLTFSRFGWIGVDLFFVLSGFLITGILLRARGAENYYSAFYARRILRLAPLYYLAVICVFAAHWIVASAPSYPFTTQIWYWLDLSNLPGAFQRAGVPPLGPFWTLAIEEQFYLIWPLLVLRLRTRTLLVMSLAAIPLEALLRSLPPIFHYNQFVKDAFSYRLTPLHSEGLFAGAALAILMAEGMLTERHLNKVRVLTAFSLGLAFAMVWADHSPAIVRVLHYTALSIAFACLIAMLALQKGEGLVSRLLSLSPLRRLGRYSYCMYVVHVPILIFLSSHFYVHAQSRAALLAGYLAALAVCIAVAALSWRVLEGPMQARKRHFPFRPAAPPSDRAEVVARAELVL